MVKRKIYVASSWRNVLQPAIVMMAKRCGHEVYDFRNPGPGNHGFRWTEIDTGWENWTPEQYRKALQHPIAKAGYELDFQAMRWCDTCLLVLPAGRSACYELGWCVGAGKTGAVVILGEKETPDLMFRELPLLISTDEVLDFLGMPPDRRLSQPKHYP